MLTDVENLSLIGQDASEPQVAAGGNDDAVFVWKRFDGTNDRIQTRTRSAAGVLSEVQTLSPAGQDASDPQVAVDADGNAVFTWVRSDGANDRVQTRTCAAAGVLGAVDTVSAAGDDASAARIAVDANGNAIVVYQTSTGELLGHAGP